MGIEGASMKANIYAFPIMYLNVLGLAAGGISFLLLPLESNEQIIYNVF